MTNIITYGTFDLLHHGHIALLRRAKSLGDHLTVGLSTDDFNLTKKKEAFHTYEHRKTLIEAIRYVDRVIPESSWQQKIQDIEKYNINIFVMGNDWKGQFDYLKNYCEVVYLQRTTGISSSEIKHHIRSTR